MAVRKYCAIIVFSFLLSSCAGGVKYKTLESYIRADRCVQAAQYVEEKERGYGPNRRLLFYLDAATVHMLCGYYEKSNEYFHKAEELAEDLWTKSITREAAAFLVSDYTIPYSGEDFERALINLFSALNYAVLGQYDEALVECRRLDANLSLYNQKYDEKNVYKEDAFGRYLSGMIYESVGNLDDAFIDYHKAFQVFQDYEKDYGTSMPSIFLEDLVRIAERVQRTEEIKPYIERFGRVRKMSYADTKKLAKIVLIHFNGKSPTKEESRIHVPTKRGPITLAFPRYKVTRPKCKSSQLIVTSDSSRITGNSELVEDINNIAVKNLNDRKGRIIAKTIARAAVKQAAIEATTNQIKSKEGREAARLLLNIVNIAVERADKRSWRTLPGEVYLARIYVPEGRHNISVQNCGKRKSIDSVVVKAGETKFVLFETMY